ncbi:MAG: tetratricopeptide repeat protein [Sphingobacteriales bacterium]|nr:MAG: tetratricopeptide repeat protein [Sphingobacteriales bacterium]
MKPLLISFILISTLTAEAQPDSLFASGNRQVEHINRWYTTSVRGRPVDSALQMLASLKKEAQRRRDQAAICAAIYYEGQFRAVRLNDARRGTQLMDRAIADAHASNRTLQEATYLHHLGYYYSFSNNYGEALHHLLRANDLFESLDSGQVFDAASNLYRVAFVYYHLEDYEEALLYSRKALALQDLSNLYTIYVANTAGQCHSKLLRADSALSYFQLTLDLARRQEQVAWIGIALGNIGNLYLEQKSYLQARPYFEQYYRNSLQLEDWSCRAEALTGLARVDLETGDHAGAMARLQQAQALFDSAQKKSKFLVEQYPRLRFLYQTLALLHQRNGSYEAAFHYQALETSIRDSLERRSLLAGASTARQQVQAEKLRGAKQLLESERKTERLRRILLASALASVLVISILLYGRILGKMRRNRERHQLREDRLVQENDRMRADLDSAEGSLKVFKENLQQKTLAFQELDQKLSELRGQEGAITEAQVDAITELTRATILTPQEWTVFRNDFERVYPDFFRRLRDRYPSLSPAEIRLLALTKLGLSTPEMAAMLGVSPDSVKKSRQRLRKELDLPQASNLQQVVDDL